MVFLSSIINLVIIIIFLIPTILGINYYFSRKNIIKKLSAVKSNSSPFVTVIVPFKGEDHRFKETVLSLCSQKYRGDYEIIFVSSDKTGRSVDILNELVPQNNKLHFVEASNNDSLLRSDKVNNLICGIKNANRKSQVYLFLDSDMVVHSKWIKYMVAPLQISDCGLSTGSAWVVSKKPGIWELSTRFWDFLALTQVTFPFTSFARGLSMGITKETYNSLNIEKVWNEAFHDNFSISKVVRKEKLKIYFAPYTIVEENFDLKGFQWIKWIKRQTVHTRKHYKRLWSFGFFLVTLPRILGAILSIFSVLVCLMNPSLLKHLFPFIIWPILHFINAVVIVTTVYNDAKYIEKYKNTFGEKMQLILSSYFTVIHCIGSIWAVFSSNIEWRKINYQNNKVVESVQNGSQVSDK